MDGWLRRPLFHLGGADVTLLGLAGAFVVVVLAWWFARLTARAVRHRMAHGHGRATGYAVARLLQYVIIGVGLAVALQTLGFDLSALVAAGAVVGVAVGFAMQSIVENFVSGVILLAERAISPGDVLTVEGRVIRIEDVGIRTTRARSRDDEELIIPNSVLVQGTVVNHTLSDTLERVVVTIGVHYDSDMRQVRRVLEATAAALRGRATARDPVVRMEDLADSAVVWRVLVWTDDPWRSDVLRAELLETIWFALLDAGIEIPYPQRDIHLRTALPAPTATPIPPATPPRQEGSSAAA